MMAPGVSDYGAVLAVLEPAYRKTRKPGFLPGLPGFFFGEQRPVLRVGVLSTPGLAT